jgi:hypothetical protein
MLHTPEHKHGKSIGWISMWAYDVVDASSIVSTAYLVPNFERGGEHYFVNDTMFDYADFTEN